MKLTYIFHSGFAVETHSCILVLTIGWILPIACRRFYPRVSLCMFLQVISTKIISPEKYFLGENTFLIPR